MDFVNKLLLLCSLISFLLIYFKVIVMLWLIYLKKGEIMNVKEICQIMFLTFMKTTVPLKLTTITKRNTLCPHYNN